MQSGLRIQRSTAQDFERSILDSSGMRSQQTTPQMQYRQRGIQEAFLTVGGRFSLLQQPQNEPLKIITGKLPLWLL